MNGGYVLDGMNIMLAVIRIKQHVVINETKGERLLSWPGLGSSQMVHRWQRDLSFAPESHCGMKCNV
jgi:hypothetical protein